MVADTAFILDANIFIEAARRYYAFDLVPVFWETIIRIASEGKAKSIDRVHIELKKGNDELAEWADTEFAEYFASTNDEKVLEAYSKLMRWADSNKQFSTTAKSVFATSADAWIIAYALAHGCTVVTHEAFAAEAKASIPIPNVCREFGISYLDTFAMLRGLGIKL